MLTYCIALPLTLACVTIVQAHDCSSRSDCGVLPPNVDIATGIAAAGAGGALGWSMLRRRNGNRQPPCKELRDEVAAGEARIKELEAKLAAAHADFGRATDAANDQTPPKDRNNIT